MGLVRGFRANIILTFGITLFLAASGDVTRSVEHGGAARRAGGLDHGGRSHLGRGATAEPEHGHDGHGHDEEAEEAPEPQASTRPPRRGVVIDA